jgi:hypothetical protein
MDNNHNKVGADGQIDMKKSLGKPYAGKLHVRFDEGVDRAALSQPCHSTLPVFVFTRKVLKGKPLRKQKHSNPGKQKSN